MFLVCIEGPHNIIRVFIFCSEGHCVWTRSHTYPSGGMETEQAMRAWMLSENAQRVVGLGLVSCVFVEHVHFVDLMHIYRIYVL